MLTAHTAFGFIRMYVSHPVFESPLREECRIWRYLDFTKLVSLFESKTLFFSRADKLGDPFEGAWPRLNVEGRRTIPPDVTKDKEATYLNQMQGLSEILRAWPTCNAVNCWHINENESAAMWRLYLKSNEGIAIQSTFAGLRDAIIDPRLVYIGIVKYIDYDTQWFDAGNLFNALIHKRKSFEHERELRAVVNVDQDGGESETVECRRTKIGDGEDIAIDVQKLVHAIYVTPDAPKWIVGLTQSLVTRYGFAIPVIQSRLQDSPLY